MAAARQLIFIILVFVAVLEGSSFLLLKFGYTSRYERPAFRISTWDELERDPSLREEAEIYKRFRSRHPEIETPAVSDKSLLAEPGKYSIEGELTGKRLFDDYGYPAPNLDDYFSLRGAVTGKIKYRVKYITNEFGRRDPPGILNPSPQRNIIFLGCSFTWGEGVEQDKIFSSRIAGKFPEARIHNTGLMGASPSTLLQKIADDKGPMLRGIDTSLPTTVVFSYFDDQIKRLVGTSEYLNRQEHFYSSDPYYFLEGDTLKSEKSFAEDMTNFRWFLKFFGGTSFAKLTGIELPYISDYHYRLTTKIFAEMETKLITKFPKFQKLIVVSFPGYNSYVKPLKGEMEKENISFIDNSDIDIEMLMKRHYRLEADSHPSALTHELYSDLLEPHLKEL